MLLVKMLLQEFNANVNIQDSKLNTALHYAVMSSNTRLVRIVLDKFPRLDLANSNGENPL
jgi:ankyrin repeat protein